MSRTRTSSISSLSFPAPPALSAMATPRSAVFDALSLPPAPSETLALSSDEDSRPPSALSLYSEASASTSVSSLALEEEIPPPSAQYATYGKLFYSPEPRSTLSFVTEAPLRLSRPPPKRRSMVRSVAMERTKRLSTSFIAMRDSCASPLPLPAPRVHFLLAPTKICPQPYDAIGTIIGQTRMLLAHAHSAHGSSLAPTRASYDQTAGKRRKMGRLARLLLRF